MRNWFDQGGGDYARFRPEYPVQLADYLASVAPDALLAVDVGCGNGQLTQLLGARFEQVIGLDPSAEQIDHASSSGGVIYRCAPAEKLPLADHSASLITAAQAAHWFDLPAFYNEVRRVAAPDAVLALISYGVLNLESELNERFQHFYWNEIGPYWPPERKLVDSGYATIDFPFKEFKAPPMQIRVEWRLPEFLGYLQTWSAVRSAKEAGREDILTQFADDITALWTDARRPVTWPINMRIGLI